MDNYTTIGWPEVQAFMDAPWYKDECYFDSEKNVWLIPEKYVTDANTNSKWHFSTEDPESGQILVCVKDDNSVYVDVGYYLKRTQEVQTPTMTYAWDEILLWARVSDILPENVSKLYKEDE